MRRQPQNPYDEQGREDDWLADDGGVDWFFEPEHHGEDEWPQREERPRQGLTRQARPAPRPTHETYLRRRRMFAAVAVGGAILIAIIIAVVASGGGGGSPQAVPTTPTVTQPVTPTPTPSPTTTTTRTQTTPTETIHVTVPASGSLREGDQGDAVVQLQKALAALGFDIGTPDGDFGSKTKDAVVAFQTQHNLTPDGVVGAATAKAINDALASSAG